MSDSMKLSPPGLDTQALAQSGAMNRAAPGAKVDPKSVDQAAKDFEAVFISQMLSHMWEGVKADETFGGGEAENTWRGMMVEQYGKQIASAGGIGMADELKAEMLRMQEQGSNKKKGMP